MTRIQPGQLAPDFQATTITGEVVQLSSIPPKKIWLSFYRYVGCPLCSSVFNAITSKAVVLKKQGVKYIAVFESDPSLFSDHLVKICREGDVAIIADPSQRLYEIYGIEKSVFASVHPLAIKMWAQAMLKGLRQPIPDASLNRLPAHFLIDEKSVVVSAYYGMHAGDHIKWETALEFATGARPFA